MFNFRFNFPIGTLPCGEIAAELAAELATELAAAGSLVSVVVSL